MVPSASKEEIVCSKKEKSSEIMAFRGGWQAKVPEHMHSTSNAVAAAAVSDQKKTSAHQVHLEQILQTPPIYYVDLDSTDPCTPKGTKKKLKGGPSSWRNFSPWKRHNRVMPTPQRTQVAFMTSPLQSSSESTISKEKENAAPLVTPLIKQSNNRPDSAPIHVLADKGVAQEGVSKTTGLYSEVTPLKVNSIEEQCMYSEVKKSSDLPPPLPPRGDETTRYVERHDSSTTMDPTKSIISTLSNSNESSDSLYESLREEGDVLVDPVDPRVYKDLHKHQDNGNVQLLSVQENNVSMIDRGSRGNETTPLHLAAAKGDKKQLEEILSTLPIIQDSVESILGRSKLCYREGVDVKDNYGRTALIYAVHHGHIDCVSLLAEAGGNVNLQSEDGSTCLHEAAYSGDLKMIATLLSLGADGLIVDNDGRLPIHWSAHNPNPDCINLLLDKVPGLTPNIEDSTKMTPLMWAAFHGRPNNIAALKGRGGDITLGDYEGMRAIHWSVRSHDIRTLQALLTIESSKYQDHKGRTVISHAAENGFVKAIGVIRNIRLSSINDQDHNGRTPLHWAAVCEKPDVIRALLAFGADAAVKDNYDYTPLDYAIHKGFTYCGLLISKHQQSLEQPTYHHVLTLGEGTGIGARTLLQQEGKIFDKEICTSQLTDEHISQLKAVCAGAWMNKFTTNGKGPVHSRFFWVDPTTMKIHWAKNIEARYIVNKDTNEDQLIGVRSSASNAILKRKDFDPVNRHKYAFTIFTKDK
jgi:ankyrin repeat protein